MKEANLNNVHVTTIRIETHNDYRKFLLHQNDDCISMSREQLIKAVAIVAVQQGMLWILTTLWQYWRSLPKRQYPLPYDWNSALGVNFHQNLGDGAHNPFDDQD